MTAVDREVLSGPTRGLVDLVAVERVLAGKPTELSEADLAYLFTHMTPSNEVYRNVGRGLGCDPDSVQRTYHRRRQAGPS